MKVLLAASEAYPLIRSGSLGDAIGALSKELGKKDIDVRVVIPKYKNIDLNIKDKLEFVKWFMVKVGWRTQYCGLFKYDSDNVKYYLVDNEYYFNRDDLYGYDDDDERFAYFDKTILELINELDWKPDIIHCNDWQTGMVPVMLKYDYASRDEYKDIKTVFSFHNMMFKGVFSPEILPDLFDYNMELFNNGSLEFYGGVSFMKGGINFADKITTVSSTYADEVKTPQYGEKLDGLLREKAFNIKGVLNGLDYNEYDPRKDPYIYKVFGNNSIKDKQINKLELQKDLTLPVNKDIPMLGLVSKLNNQKGLELIINIADKLLQHNIQLVILGTGDRQYEEHFKGLQSRYKDKVSTNIKYDKKLAHKIYAGCDMLLKPSLLEPCGSGQLIALRYGTIPIGRETGGLKDTILPYNKYNGKGNGFSFSNFNANELLMIIEYALDIYQDKECWKSIVDQAMNSDYSWEKSASEYSELYCQII
ncbi:MULTISPECIES: glycogen synthase GlgA [Clostridium]|uniref:Glycogen synthase n=1 Tax=Clostridium cibarium TaxID=2762247 RepID=A0ABR8PZ63_9CLOT|nr:MULTISPECIES: glycogen synthase GlgA [Clostridium]MBD7913459.1 glycogen synthase GlgA [Clostridium cibarium]